MKSLHWRISATLLFLILAVGIQFSDFIAQKMFRDACKLIGEKYALEFSAVQFVHSIWIGSKLWLLLWIPLGLGLFFTWIPKLDWIGAILTLVSTVLVASSLCYIPTAGWVIAYSTAAEMARVAVERRRSTASEQHGADQPATAPQSKPQGNSNPQPESEARSQ